MVNKLSSKNECPIDVLLLGIIDNHLDLYHKYHITPNIVTTFSIISGILSAYNIYLHNFKLAALFFAIAYYFDCVDGKIARKFNQVTVFGDYYDHFGDIFKLAIVLYALYITNSIAFHKIKYFILFLFIAMLIHFGCQEKLDEYKQYQKSQYLNIFTYLIPNNLDPNKCIQYTKYFGCGTFMVFMIVIIAMYYVPKKKNK